MEDEEIYIEEEDPVGDQILQQAANYEYVVRNYMWHWDLFGDNNVVIKMPGVSWWQRFWTKVFFLSKWTKI